MRSLLELGVHEVPWPWDTAAPHLGPLDWDGSSALPALQLADGRWGGSWPAGLGEPVPTTALSPSLCALWAGLPIFTRLLPSLSPVGSVSGEP